MQKKEKKEKKCEIPTNFLPSNWQQWARPDLMEVNRTITDKNSICHHWSTWTQPAAVTRAAEHVCAAPQCVWPPPDPSLFHFSAQWRHVSGQAKILKDRPLTPHSTPEHVERRNWQALGYHYLVSFYCLTGDKQEEHYGPVFFTRSDDLSLHWWAFLQYLGQKQTNKAPV